MPLPTPLSPNFTSAVMPTAIFSGGSTKVTFASYVPVCAFGAAATSRTRPSTVTFGSAQNVTVHGIPTEYSRYCFSVKEM